MGGEISPNEQYANWKAPDKASGTADPNQADAAREYVCRAKEQGHAIDGKLVRNATLTNSEQTEFDNLIRQDATGFKPLTDQERQRMVTLMQKQGYMSGVPSPAKSERSSAAESYKQPMIGLEIGDRKFRLHQQVSVLRSDGRVQNDWNFGGVIDGEVYVTRPAEGVQRFIENPDEFLSWQQAPRQVEQAGIGQFAKPESRQEPSSISRSSAEQAKPILISEHTAEEIAHLVKSSQVKDIRHPVRFREIMNLYGLENDRIAQNDQEGQEILRTKLPFKIERTQDGKQRLVWSTGGLAYRWLDDVVGKYPNDYPRIIANYLNQAVKNSRRNG